MPGQQRPFKVNLTSLECGGEIMSMKLDQGSQPAGPFPRFLHSWVMGAVLLAAPGLGTAQTTITVDPSERFQNILGWECVSFAAQDDPMFAAFKDVLFERVINEAGINRVRREVRSGAESGTDYFLSWSEPIGVEPAFYRFRQP
jgi:hypothetical protein